MRTSMVRAAAGLAAVVLVALALAAPAHAASRRPPVDVEAIAAALGRDPVHLDPTSRLTLSPDQLAQLRADVAASPDPLRVVVLGRVRADENPRDLAAAIARHVPDPGWLLVYADDTLPSFGGSYADDDLATQYLGALGAVSGDRGTPAERLLAITGRLAGRTPTPDPFDFSTDTPDAPTPARVTATRVAAVAVAALLLLGVVVVGVRWAGRRGASDWRTHRLTRAVSRGRAADRSIQAQRAVLDLGSRLDETEMAAGDDAAAWQAALDAYDHAGRLLDRVTGRAGGRAAGRAGAGPDAAADLDRVVALCREGGVQLDRTRRTAPHDG